MEDWKSDYTDSENNKRPYDEFLYGGKIGLEYDVNYDHLLHASISRGYKAGGVNTNISLPKDKLDYGTEYLWNFEVGINSSFKDNTLNTRLSMFYASRKDQQLKSSVAIKRDDGSTEFIEYFKNADTSKNIGLEAELDWKLNTKWNITASLGLLKATFNNNELKGREQAHAPNYQYTLGAEYNISDNLKAGINLEGKDGFYFSDSHNAKAKSYNLLNASLSHKKKNWTTTLWGRNLLNKDYDTRGFRFGNNPAKGYIDETYTQKGEPRTVGLTVSYDF